MKDFFISYNSEDKHWAEWIAWILEEAGYSVVFQAWDFRPGGNFVLEMHMACIETQRTIAVLSEHYIQAVFTQSEWTAAFVQDPKSREGRLIPIRVKECQPEGLLASITYVDVVGLLEQDARGAILGAFSARAKPKQSPQFPGGAADRQIEANVARRAAYPGMAKRPKPLAGRVDASPIPTQNDYLPLERVGLFRALRALSAKEFNILVFALKPPAEVIPPMPALPDERVRALLQWAEGDGGQGLANVRKVLDEIRNPLPARCQRKGRGHRAKLPGRAETAAEV